MLKIREKHMNYSPLPVLLLSLLLLFGLSACTRFNLTEQFPAGGRQVPVVLPDTQEAVFYEKEGKFYRALSVAMATENVPLLTSRLRHSMAPYASTTTYNPAPDSARLYLFQLTEDEADILQQTIRAQQRNNGILISEPISAAEPPKEIPPVLPAYEFDFTRARKLSLKLSGQSLTNELLPYELRRPIATRSGDCEYPSWELPATEPYPTAALPAKPGSRSLGKRLALAPVWMADTAGNLVLGCAESTVTLPLSLIALPILGIMYICDAELP